MADGSPPVTRLSTAEAAEGWMNCVSSPEPMEKPCQLMMAFSEPWMMVRVLPSAPMVAEPAITEPRVGLAHKD